MGRESYRSLKDMPDIPDLQGQAVTIDLPKGGEDAAPNGTQHPDTSNAKLRPTELTISLVGLRRSFASH